MALILALVKADAQYDPSLSHYFDLETGFNPAAAGKQNLVNIAAAYALDMAGFEHNPRTLYVSGDLPLYFMRAWHGAGAQVMSEKIGLFTHQKIGLQYARKFKLWGGKLSVGAQLGLINEKFSGSGVDTEEPDPAFPKADVSGYGLDVGAGLYYTRGQWYAGVSVMHATSPTIRLENSELKIDRSYYLTGGYNIKLRNPFVTIKPSLLFKTDLLNWRADLTGRVVYTNEKRVLYAGATYSPANSVTFLVGGSFHGVLLGYSYELYTSAINPGNGSHELYIGYRTTLNFGPKGHNKHKSVRIL